jgi:protein-S-isoprenylcysteine O-methyltransferase Ste14
LKPQGSKETNVLALASAQNTLALFLFATSLALPAEGNLSTHRAFLICQRAWFIWIVWWVLMAFFSKSAKRRESIMQRFEHLVPTVLGIALVFDGRLRLPGLRQPVIPDLPALALLSVVVTVLGLVFAVWARLALGANWSGSITIKKGHQLIRHGPYRFIRHPIYTGMLAALLGTAIAQQLLGGLLGFAVVLFALYRKARREESFLSQEFGEAFVEHQKHTGMFLPHLS